MAGDSICPACGSRLRRGARFCRTCGAPSDLAPTTTAAATAVDSQTRRCPRCEHVNPRDSRFCRACGASLEGSATSQAPTVTHETVRPKPADAQGITPDGGPRARRSRAIAGIAAAGALALVIAGIAVVILTASSSQSAASDATTIASSSNTSSSTQSSGSGDTTSSTTSQATGSSSTASSSATQAGFRNEDFTASPPAGWTMVENGTRMPGYVETKWVRPGSSGDLVKVDVSPGSIPPLRAANQVRALLTKEDGYRQVSFGPADLTSGPSAEWIFTVPGSERVDFFFTVCGMDFAALGSTSPARFADLFPTFSAFVNSIQRTCG
jgi:hypothetical protein